MKKISVFNYALFFAGIIIGLVVGLLLSNPSIGLALGLALGLILSLKRDKKLTKRELRVINKITLVSVIMLVIMIIIAIGVILTNLNLTSLANPSATYCESKGYVYDIRDTPLGSKGFCIFDNGAECGGWSYYRGDCNETTASVCRDLCGDGTCQEVVCEAVGCPCAENNTNCPEDC
ncbi:MAG: DUF333 domain-containing protein [Candidatus Nanoarchaeia archaeon]|jgi:putative hemolysin